MGDNEFKDYFAKVVCDANITFNHCLMPQLGVFVEQWDTCGDGLSDEGLWIAILILERMARLKVKASGMPEDIQIAIVRSARTLGDHLFKIANSEGLSGEHRKKVADDVEQMLNDMAAKINDDGGTDD